VTPGLNGRLVRHARAARRLVGMSVIFGVCSAACVVGQALLLASGISKVFLAGAGVSEVTAQLTALIALTAIRGLVAAAQESASIRAAATVKSDFRRALLGRLAHPAMLPTSTAGLTDAATRDLDGIDPYFARYLPQLVTVGVVTPLFVVAICAADWVSGLIVAACVPLVPVFMAMIGVATQRHAERHSDTLHRLSRHFLDLVDGLTTLRVFGRAKAQQQSLAAVGEDLRQATMASLRLSFLSAFVLELIASLSVALVAVQISLRLLDGTVDLRTALVVLLLAPEAFTPFRMLGASYHAASDGMAAVRRCLDIIDMPVPPAGTRLDVPRAGERGLLVDAVTVQVGARSRVVMLAPTSLELTPGRLVGIVGPSGCGKSTLIGVLRGALPCSGGTVRVGGVDLAEVDPRAWLTRVAWLPQRPRLVAGSVAANVRLGAPSAGEDEVRRALRRAAADIDPRLILGEDGAGVSAGQRQRIALARAFLRAERGADLVLLDEPTAHLDVGTEQLVLAGIRELLASRCVMMVTHRPAVAAVADDVIHAGQAAPEIVGVSQ
jgi:ATP-binding cassette subfamily C protein CydCD